MTLTCRDALLATVLAYLAAASPAAALTDAPAAVPTAAAPSPAKQQPMASAPAPAVVANATWSRDIKGNASAAPFIRALSPAELAAWKDRTAKDVKFVVDDTKNFFLKHGVDEKEGGFYGTIARNGSSVEPTAKGLIVEGRYLWMYSVLAERNATLKPEVAGIMNSTFRFLVDKFYDPSDAMFVQRVARDGSRLTLDLKGAKRNSTELEEANVIDAGAHKWLYGQPFAILGLAAYARAFNSSEALGVAMDNFRSIDAKFHDAEFGGWDQLGGDDSGLYIDFPGNARPAGALGQVAKTNNLHYALLPGLTELYKASKDPVVGDRLAELVILYKDRLTLPEGYTAQFFTRDWQPLINGTIVPTGPGSVEGTKKVPLVLVGHDLKTVQYVYEAAEALIAGGHPQGRATLAASAGVSDAVATIALRHGYDWATGGFYNVIDVNGTVIDDDHVWWVQNEAPPALYRLYQLTNDTRLLDMVDGTLAWIKTKGIDPVYGEQYWGVYPNGTIDERGTNKAEFWKAGYHVLHGMLGMEDLVAPLEPASA